MGENERVMLTPKNSSNSDDQLLSRSEVRQWTHLRGHYKANTSANTFHLASETLLSISLHLLNDVLRDLGLPVIDERWHPLDALNT